MQNVSYFSIMRIKKKKITERLIKNILYNFYESNIISFSKKQEFFIYYAFKMSYKSL